MKYISIVLTFLLLIGCVNKEQLKTFDLTSSERIEKRKSDLRAILQSAHNGWLVEFNPDESLPTWYLYMKFISDTDVEITSNFNLETSTIIKSTYSIVLGSTIKLLFDTYNRNIHLFSDTGTNGSVKALYGDSAFLYYGEKKNGTELEFRVNRNFKNIVKFIRWESENPPDFEGEAIKIQNLINKVYGNYTILKETNLSTMEVTTYSGFPSQSDPISIKFYRTSENTSTGIVTYPYSTNSTDRFISRMLFEENKIYLDNYKSLKIDFGEFIVEKNAYVVTVNNIKYELSFHLELPLNVKDYKELFSGPNRIAKSYLYNRSSLPSFLPSIIFSQAVSGLIEKQIIVPSSSGNYIIWFYFNTTDANYIFLNSEMGVANDIRIKVDYELKDNFLIFKDKGYLNPISTPKTTEAEALLKPFKDIIFNEKGWHVINLGLEVVNRTANVYYFTSRAEPSISFVTL